jgi:beta-lactamase regulating signal transducer with metallopeptidase domain
MIELLFLVKASVVVSTAALTLALVGRRSSAASRHLVCSLAVAGLLALPILSLALPAWWLVRLPEFSAVADHALPTPLSFSDVAGKYVPDPAEAGRHITGPADAGHHVRSAAEAGDYVPAQISAATLAPLLSSRWFWLLLYGSGALLLTVRLLVDRFAVRCFARRAVELHDPEWETLFRECVNRFGVHGQVRLLQSSERTTPMAIGIRHRAIVLPAVAGAWPDALRRAVLLHELAHVARRDCLTQTAAAFACALYWIHPGSWWLARRLRIERELACDDLVLAAGTDACDYAGHLLELAYTLRGHGAPALAVGMAAPRQLEARMLALLDRARNRTTPTRLRLAVTLAIFTTLIVPIAATTAINAQSAGAASASEPTPNVRDREPELLRRVLSVEYWRQAAAEQLARLADQMNYLSEMRQLGYSVADVDVLFRLRQHGVTPEYVRALAAEGLSGLSTDDLLTAVSHGISADYVRDLKSLGYQPLGIAALTRLRSHGIDGDFIRELQALGYRPSLDALVLLRSHGVETMYIRELQALGYADLTPEALAALRSHGVTTAQVQSANERAGMRLSVGQLTTLASHGWRP